MPHHLFIFRKPDPLGTELNNSACSRLETMFYLRIKKGKVDMKLSDFQQQIGGKSAQMKRITKATKGCGQIS